MRTTRRRAGLGLLGLIALALLLVAAPGETPAHGSWHSAARTVYTMTNDDSGNEIVGFSAAADGTLTQRGSVATGGLGSGGGLGNQGGLALSGNRQWLLAVNAGSDDVSVFRIGKKGGPKLTDRAWSGGNMPISVAIHGRLVYVLNNGAADGDRDEVVGFWLTRHGRLLRLPGSDRPLSADSVGPAQVGFSPDGRFLLVTEKATNSIVTFRLGGWGYAWNRKVNAAAGTTPFAFDFGRHGVLYVAEVFGGAEDAGAVSSYRIRQDGTLDVLAASVPNTETAPCWLKVSKNGKYVFTTNTPDDSLSAFVAKNKGGLELVDADGRTGEPGAGTNPLDMDLSGNGRFLYTLNIGSGAVGAFRVGSDGSLTYLGEAGSVPGHSNGLIAR